MSPATEWLKHVSLGDFSVVQFHWNLEEFFLFIFYFVNEYIQTSFYTEKVTNKD